MPQCTHMSGLFISSSQNIAPIVHSLTQFLHPMHLPASNITPPPSLFLRALVGQTFMQGGSGQPRQTTTMKPLSTPPAEPMCIADFPKPASPKRLVQANIQD